MTREELKERMDKIVDNILERIELCAFDGNKQLSAGEKEILVYSILPDMANAVGQKIQEVESGSGRFKYECFFEYCGVKFYTLTNVRMLKDAGTDGERNG